ncbi:MAG: hypothetical protein ACXW6K_16440 [Candidatus Binatia bacterium]
MRDLIMCGVVIVDFLYAVAGQVVDSALGYAMGIGEWVAMMN